MFNEANQHLEELLKKALVRLETEFKADVIVYNGIIGNGLETVFKRAIEKLQDKQKYKDRVLYVVLTTMGGSVEVVEQLVTILRYWYKEVRFIIPEYAYSAGTILCMNGDDIYMDYSSVLGPIDPQVQNKDGVWVPALGYLDKVAELINKNASISTAEVLLLQKLDLAALSKYEQATQLTNDLLTNWLSKYKFKNWLTHRDGTAVTEDEKKTRAEDIAKALADIKKWRSHSRPITIKELEELRLRIIDYTNEKYKLYINDYHFLCIDYIMKMGYKYFMQTRADIIAFR